MVRTTETATRATVPGQARVGARPFRTPALLFVCVLVCVGLLACRRKPAATKPACTQVACDSGFTANVLVASSTMRKGFHRIDVTVDGTELSCAFEFPPKVSGEDWSVHGSCQPGLITMLKQVSAGQLAESITVLGTPKAVGITETVEEKPVFEHFFAPVYQVTPSAEPGCDQTCRQATARWEAR